MGEFLRQGIDESLADVFESVFLIPLEPLVDAAPSREALACRRDYFEVRIDSRRQDNFPVFFFFPVGLIIEIADRFLGMDGAGMDTGELAQVGKMVARMTIGGLLGRVDPEALVLVGEPQVRTIDNFNPGQLLEAPGIWGYQSGQGYIWVDVGWAGEVTQR